MTGKPILVLGMALLAFTVAACEGPMGPGGDQGPPGEQGLAGADALNTCVQCHGNDARLVAIEWQYRNSPHYENRYWYREGACMACHTHEGFITTAVNGETLPARFENQSPINCRTCHQIHTTFTSIDLAFTTNSPVDLTVGGTFNVNGANLCANCHQARAMSPMASINGPAVTMSGSAAGRYGPHYGTQANVMGASGMFHFTGSATIPNPASNPHATACSSCHMVARIDHATPLAGGHTFRNSYDDGAGQLVNACTQCHSSAVSFDHPVGMFPEGAQVSTATQMARLRDLLLAEGVMTATGTMLAGTWDANVVAAYVNYRFIYYDSSGGVHYPEYVWAVLNNTIEMLEAR